MKLFYSYSIADESYRKKIETALAMLRRYDCLQSWNFRKILPGKDLNLEIDSNLKNSDIILLLVSPDFLASNYCYDIEVKKAMELHTSGEAIVCPIILRECDWQHEKCPFRTLEALPENGKPIAQWKDFDSVLNQITQQLKTLLTDLKQKTNLKSYHNVTPEENQNTLQQALTVFQQKAEKLDYNSSIDEIKKVEALKRELYEQIIGKVDLKIKNIPALKENTAHILFERIYASENLDALTIQEIRNLKDNKDIYEWHQRKIIVNAITLSLLNFKKFDVKKANLLFEFLSDFEEQVWKHALTGLLISLIYHKNRWTRHTDLKKKLETLRESHSVQDELNNIECVLRYKLYTEQNLPSEFYSSSFFENPINYFIPFYPENPILKRALDNNLSDIDAEYFQQYLMDMPFLDAYKYSLCLALEKGNLIKAKMTKEDRYKLFRSIRFSSIFDPHLSSISEYYNFFKHFPKQISENIFNDQLSISRTSLKHVILDQVSDLTISADILMDEESFSAAIPKYLQILQINPNEQSTLWKIASCYKSLKPPDYLLARKYLKQLEKIDEKDKSVLLALAENYYFNQEYKECIAYCDKILDIFPNLESALLRKAQALYCLEEYDSGLKLLFNSIEVYPESCSLHYEKARFFDKKKDYHLVVEELLIALEFVTEDKHENIVDIYLGLTRAYMHSFDFELSKKYADLAIAEMPKNHIALSAVGRAYFFGGFDRNKALQCFEKSNAIKEESITYGNLGHMALLEGNIERAKALYMKCITIMNDTKDFEEKYMFDLPYMEKIGVDQEVYLKLRDEVITHYLANIKFAASNSKDSSKKQSTTNEYSMINK